MKKILGLAILATFSVSAFSASFPCEKAKTEIERMICASPVLSELDDELADVYKKNKANDNYDFVQNFQRQWLKSRNQCKDEACVHAAYQTRLRELRLEPLDAEDTLTGRYEFGKGNGYQGYGYLLKLAPDRFRYELYVASGEPAWHTGGAAGEARLEGGVARTIPASSSCRLNFRLEGTKVKTSHQPGGKFGDCALGARVSMEAVYQKHIK